MAFYRNEDGTLKWEAIAWLLLGAYLLSRGIKQQSVTLVPAGGICLLISIGKGLQRRWADWLVILFLSAGLVLAVRTMMLSGIATRHVLVTAATVYAIWHVWSNEIRRPKMDADDDGDEKSLVSLVLLLSKPRYLDEAILAHVVESAWGGDYTNPDDEKRDGFVVSHQAINMIKSPMGMFALNNFPNPYWQDIDKVVHALPDLRLRKVVQDHQAWLSVDLLADDDTDPHHAAAYAAIIRLLHELADETVLGILRPETGRISEWSDQVLDSLLHPRGEEQFHRAGNVPIVQVPADAPEMVAAVAEAQHRWPEFVSAFAKRQPEDHFSVKAPVTVGDVTEYIWIQVLALEPGYIHGELANNPLSLGDLKLGSRVEIPERDLNDWAFAQGGAEPVGLFTVKVILNPPK